MSDCFRCLFTALSVGLTACGAGMDSSLPSRGGEGAGDEICQPADDPTTTDDSAAVYGQGTECRNWVAGPNLPPVTSQARYSVTARPGIKIPMRDGTVLDGILFEPALPPGEAPAPCIAILDGYGNLGLLPATPSPAPRGFPVLWVAMRGTGLSEGKRELYNYYMEDGYDTVEWMAGQPWCNGRVGLTGLSLYGITQWLAAKAAPPHLVTLIPDVSCGDCYWDVWYPGGMMYGPGRAARGAAEVDYAREHRNFDEQWRDKWSLVPHDYAAMAQRGIPVMIFDGWVDFFLAANTRSYERLVAAGGTAKLILGPWGHGGQVSQGTDLRPYDTLTYQAMWYHRYLRGEANGIDHEPPVLLYVEGPNRWRYENAWPIKDARPVRLYLSAAKSGSIRSLNDGTFSVRSPGAKAESASIDYSPETGPFVNANAARQVGDQSANEATVLTWTSAPLEVATEITGWSTLRLWSSATAEDNDFVVLMSDVAADGSSIQVSRGFLNAQRYFDRTHPAPLSPDTARAYDVEIWPQSHVYPVGHRIRISVAGAATQTAQPGNTDDAANQAPGLNQIPSTITIHQDAVRASHLTVPVVGTARLPGEF